MATKRQRPQPKKNKNNSRTIADDTKIAPQAAPPAKAGETSKSPSVRKKKLAAIGLAGAQVAIAGQAGLGLAQEAIHGVREVITSPSGQLPDLSGGGYFFSKDWEGYAASITASQISAERMAELVVEIALQETARGLPDAAAKRRLVQWVLAGNMTPAEAATILAGGPRPDCPQLEALKYEIIRSTTFTVSMSPPATSDVLTSDDHSSVKGSGNYKYWYHRSSPGSMLIVHGILALVNEVTPGMELRYTKNYIGLVRNRVMYNFVTLEPSRDDVSVYFRIPLSAQVIAIINDSGIQGSEYIKRSGRFRIRLSYRDLKFHRDLLLDLIRGASKTPYPP